MCIEFALFGLGSYAAESLLAKKATTASVTLKFSVNDTAYEVHRDLKKNTDGTIGQVSRTSYLRTDSATEMLSPTDLKPRILGILGFNEPVSTKAGSRIFRYAVFTPQEEMKTILENSKTRLETIRKAFRIEDYSTAYNNASLLATAISHNLDIFAAHFDKLDDMKSDMKSKQDKISQIEPALQNLRAKRKDAELEESSKQDTLQDLRARLNKKTVLQGELGQVERDIDGEKKLIATHEQRISRNRDELESAKALLDEMKSLSCPTDKDPAQISKEIKKFAGFRDEISGLDSQIRSAGDRIKKLEQKLDADILANPSLLDETMSAKRSMLNKCIEDLDDMTQKHGTFNNLRVELETRQKTLEKGIGDLMGLGSKCQYCGHTLTPEHIEKQKSERTGMLDDIASQLANALHDLDGAAASRSDLESRLSDMQDQLRRLEEMKPVLSDYQSETSRKEYDVSRLEELRLQNTISAEPSFPNSHDDPISYLSALRDARMQYDESKKREQDLLGRHDTIQNTIQQDSAAMDASRVRIGELEKSRSELISRVQTMQGVEGEIKASESALKEVQDRIRAMDNEISRNEADLDTFKTNIVDAEKQIAEAEDWRDKHALFSKYRDWLRNFFLPTVLEIEKQVLISIRSTFDATYRDWYRILVEDPTKDSYIDEDFTPKVSQDGYEQSVEHLSGGEKTSVSLAYRITLNSLIRKETDSLKSNLLILDEPTDGFSKAQLQKVKTLFDQLKSQQIILVSHEKDLESYVDNVFHVSKSNGQSMITPGTPSPDR